MPHERQRGFARLLPTNLRVSLGLEAPEANILTVPVLKNGVLSEKEVVVVDPQVEADKAEFVEHYDTLNATKAVELLSESPLEQLPVIRDHEAANKNRKTVLEGIDRMMGESS